MAGLMVGLHAGLALRTNCPELAITEHEGRDFMRAAQNVMRHYKVETTQKTIDWIMFVGAVGMMYGPRALAISQRRREERNGGGEKVVNIGGELAARRARRAMGPVPAEPSPKNVTGGFAPTAGGFAPTMEQTEGMTAFMAVPTVDLPGGISFGDAPDE